MQRVLPALVVACLAAIVVAETHPADARAATAVSAGQEHSCAIRNDGQIVCWGRGGSGRLGYGNTQNVGDDESPGSVGPVNLGPGRTARAIAAGALHTCAILDSGQVKCWGRGDDGQLGSGSRANVGDDELPSSVGVVDLGPGRTATAIAAGDRHTCVILDTGQVECWGRGQFGRLGYGNTKSVGDDETPASVGPVDLGPGHTARAITAGWAHTCVILDNGLVRCWGSGGAWLGNGTERNVGDNETPGTIPPVSLGRWRVARAISTGYSHTCAVLDNRRVRCWGENSYDGNLGLGKRYEYKTVGDNEVPTAVPPVDLGAGRRASAIAVGGITSIGGPPGGPHTCAILTGGQVRCWGDAYQGQLGYGNTHPIGDDETPGSAGPVRLGRARRATAIAAAGARTCALLDSGAVRCWGQNTFGQLGIGNTRNIGNDETPASVKPINLGEPK